MIRLVVVEDDPRYLSSLRLLFSSAEGITQAGAFESAEAALTAVDWNSVDVLLSDLDLPGLTGSQLIAVAKGQSSDLLALAHTVHEQRENLFEALRAGAGGYIVKGSTGTALVDSIHAISRILPPRRSRLSRLGRRTDKPGTGGPPPLHKRPLLR